MPALSMGWDFLAFGFLMLSVVLAWWKPFDRRFNGMLLGLLVLYGLQDQLRWQPWCYQYVLMLLPFTLLSQKPTDDEIHYSLNIARIILIGVYVWGGINKFQPGFFSVYENSLMKPILMALDNSYFRYGVLKFVYCIPVIELGMGLGLLFRKTRWISIVLACLTHVYILVILGPIKGGSNIVVIPWNFMMIASVVLLFLQIDFLKIFPIRLIRLRLVSYFCMFLVGVMPLFYYTGHWDRYLAFHLYSGRQKRLYIMIDKAYKSYLPDTYRTHLQDNGETYVLQPAFWAYKELGVPLLTEDRIFKAFSQKLCTYNIPEEALLFYMDYKHIYKEKHVFLRCRDL